MAIEEILIHDTPGHPALQELGHQRVHEQTRRQHLASSNAEVPWVQQGWVGSSENASKKGLHACYSKWCEGMVADTYRGT